MQPNAMRCCAFLLFFGGLCLPAQAKCNYLQLNAERMALMLDAVYEGIEINDPVNLYSNARTFGDDCLFLFLKSYGTGVTLTKAAIASPPEKGKLAQLGGFRFRYTPPAEFKGIDRLAVELCGSRSGRSEICFKINYAIEVRCTGEEDCGGTSEPPKPDKKF
jgi:hypothetical protein